MGTGAVLIAFAIAAAAQSYRDVTPTPPPPNAHQLKPPVLPEGDPNATQVAVETLRGLVFSADHSGQPSVTEAAQGAITAQGLPLLDAQFLAGFSADLGRPMTFGRLARIRRAVVQRFREAGQPLVDVYVPEQDVSGGVVRIAVASYRLGKVTARGNRYFSDSVLTGEMPLTSGESISEADVTSGLALLNLNPYRTVNVVYAPGAAKDSTDVVLETQDRLPLRLSAGYDNGGVSQLGRDRFFAGIDYGNLFGLDQEIGYQLTTNSDVFDGRPDIFGGANHPRFVGHSFNYSAPLPWLDRVELFGMYAQGTPDLPDSYGQTGISAQLSFRYDLRIASSGQWQQQMQFGYDFKRSNNNLEFGGFQVFGSNTHIHQFVIAYDATKTDALGQAAVNATLFLSPGHFDGDDNDAAFNTSRLGATARYAYIQSSVQRDVAIGAGFSLYARGVLQWTPNTLLPSEELGLGGDTSVRGYEPYVVLGDRGWNLQTELRTPPLAFGTTGTALQPFLFIDAGHAWNRIDEPAEQNNGSLVSAGAGLRFQMSRFVAVRGTVGFPLRAALPGGKTSPLAVVYVVIGT
ncbi:ShlB/FhaC/HecB family hemolysin secretion/activation protein [Caballeronia sp. 15715]|uniref:ShlB/FhaC/HecB family hemolysin secretion/activation protein n=1 Tax=unclassified Caballeronia TaxID=2646786 RepID=UPI0039E40EC8